MFFILTFFTLPFQAGNQDSRSDRDLVREVLQGRLESYDVLIERYKKLCSVYLYRMTYSQNDAEDLAQEAFFKAYQNLASFRGEKFSSWLLRIAHNCCMDLFRSRKVKEMELNIELDGNNLASVGGESTEEKVEYKEFQQDMIGKIMQLPPVYRGCFLLKILVELEYSDISFLLGIPLNTVKSRIRKSREFLASHLPRCARESMSRNADGPEEE